MTRPSAGWSRKEPVGGISSRQAPPSSSQEANQRRPSSLTSEPVGSRPRGGASGSRAASIRSSPRVPAAELSRKSGSSLLTSNP